MDEVEIGRRLRRALARHQAGDLAGAEAGYRDVLALDPEQADALHLLGVIADQQGRPAEAVELIGRAIRRNPKEAGFHGNLGNALLALGRKDEAELAYHAALALDPAQADAHYNLGNILREAGVGAEAETSYRAALAADPQHLGALRALAKLCWEASRVAEADLLFRQIHGLAPQDAEAMLDHALFRLSCDQFSPGWALYEARWQPDIRVDSDWGGGLPRWRGEPLDGRHLLLWGEQGIGDQILFGTMLHEAIALARRSDRPGRISVAVTDRLVPLFRRALADLDVAVLVRQEAAGQADLQCPFGSLGGMLRPNPAAFAGQDGVYLQADAGFAAQLRRRYEAWARPGDRLIGLSWRSANARIGAAKSIPLPALAPLFHVPGITWVSVQYGDVAEEIASSGVPLHADPAIDAMRDLDAAAAQLAALDGLVSVSSSAVHLAGALGLPCDVLLARGAGRLWYWPDGIGKAAAQSRWYRSLRLWQQVEAGQWAAPINALVGKLCR